MVLHVMFCLSTLKVTYINSVDQFSGEVWLTLNCTYVTYY